MLNNCLQANLSQSVASKSEVKSVEGRKLFKFLTGTKLPMSDL